MEYSKFRDKSRDNFIPSTKSVYVDKKYKIKLKDKIIDNSIINRAFLRKHIYDGICTFPKDVELIGADAFAHNNIEFHNTRHIKFVDDRGFLDSGLCNFIFPQIEVIGARAFKDNNFDVRTVNIPNTCISIKDEAFMRCEFQSTVAIYGDSIVDIGQFIFRESNLKSIRFYNIPYVGYGMFTDCPALTRVSFDDNTCNEIMNCAFRRCRSLKTIHIPEGVEYVGYASFEDCIQLQRIYIPKSAKEINYRAFWNVHPEAKIYVPKDNNLNDMNFLNEFKYKNIIYVD